MANVKYKVVPDDPVLVELIRAGLLSGARVPGSLQWVVARYTVNRRTLRKIAGRFKN